MSQRRKGKEIERWFINNGLKEIFPEIRRNAGTQSQSGGVDLENTPGFNFEVKGGMQYYSKMIKDVLEQVDEEGDPKNWDVALIRPQNRSGRRTYEPAYALIPFEHFLEMIQEILLVADRKD